jgi:uncharacterized protein DUF4919
MRPFAPAIRAVFLALSAGWAACASSGATQPPPSTAARPPASLTAAPDQPAPRPADADEDVAYYRALIPVIAGQQADRLEGINFRRFRRGRLYEAGVGPLDKRFPGNEVSAAFDRKDFKTVADLTGAFLTQNPASIRAHMLRSVALSKLERTKESDFHRAVAVGLVKSILGSGDGHSKGSAFIVYQVAEEYDLMEVLGVAMSSQSLTGEGARMFDVMDGTRVEGGEKVKMYFDITEVWAQELREHTH